MNRDDYKRRSGAYLVSISLFIMSVLLALTAGTSAENSRTESGRNLESGTIIFQDITSDTTWTQAGSPYYVIDEITIRNGSSLQIAPGSTVIFYPGAKISIDQYPIRDNSLVANGHQQSRILFYCIDNSTETFYAEYSGEFSFINCDFYRTGLIYRLSSPNSLFQGCNFYQCRGIFIDEDPGLNIMMESSRNNTVIDCNFFNCDDPLRVYTNGETFVHSNNFLNCVFQNDLIQYSGGMWNDSLNRGNYWSDYEGSDVDSDGIGETDLPWHGVDRYPLMDPSQALDQFDQVWFENLALTPEDDSDWDGQPDVWENSFGLNPSDPSDNYADADSDGLMNIEEFIHGTDPWNDDSDDDALLDGEEVKDHGTNPLSEDTDDDGISDIEEVIQYHTNPLTNDTDNDGISDHMEIFQFNTDPLMNDTDSDGLTDHQEIFIYNTDPHLNDTDADGLTDYEEVRIYNTDPNSPDTDNDQIPDLWEIEHGLNPVDASDAGLDNDQDGLDNAGEYNSSTDPGNNDTDGDDWSDMYEIECGSDPQDSTDTPTDTDGDGIPDTMDGDVDGDGWNNSMEISCDTDPWDPLSVPSDLDGDLIPDKLDDDTDGDGWDNDLEIISGSNQMDSESYPSDIDGDWIPDILDMDADGDGWNNSIENITGSDPLNASSWPHDMDWDGVLDYYDNDADGDGWDNLMERSVGSDPLNNASVPSDIDRDGIPDSLDEDMDGDGYPDREDLYPRDPDKWEDDDAGDTVLDTDNDGSKGFSTLTMIALIMLIILVLVFAGIAAYSSYVTKDEMIIELNEELRRRKGI